jgi:hypothetical protein
MGAAITGHLAYAAFEGFEVSTTRIEELELSVDPRQE